MFTVIYCRVIYQTSQYIALSLTCIDCSARWSSEQGHGRLDSPYRGPWQGRWFSTVTQ